MHSRALLLYSALLAALIAAGCYTENPFADDDDDVTGSGDDDDASDDDDDDASDDDDDVSDDDDDATLPEAEPVPDANALLGRVYSLDLGAATWVEPKGAGGIIGTLLNDEYLLFSLVEESSLDAADQPGAHLVGGAGETSDSGAVIQDLCNESLNLTAGPDAEFFTSDDTPATWTNPWLELGPTDLSLEVSGAPTTLQDMELEGRFEPDMSAFVDGRLFGVLDGRALDDTLGGGLGAACDFVLEAYGVACHECGAPNPGPYCLTVVAESLLGTFLDGTALSPRSCSDIIWNYVATGACESAAAGYDVDGDGAYEGCPEFDG